MNNFQVLAIPKHRDKSAGYSVFRHACTEVDLCFIACLPVGRLKIHFIDDWGSVALITEAE